MRELRTSLPAAKLADAHLEIARGHGFPSWRALRAFVELTPPSADRRFANWLGFYRPDPTAVRNELAEVVADGGRLFLESGGGSRLELTEPSPGRLVIAGVDMAITFESAEAGPARAMIQHVRDCEIRLARIELAEAQAIRSARAQALADQGRSRSEVRLDPEVLSRHVGHYLSPLGPSIEISCREARLFAQVVGQPQMEVCAESESRFFYRGLPIQLEFVSDAGRTQALIVHQNGLEQRLDRVSAEEAARVAGVVRQRAAEQERPRSLASIEPALLGRYAGRYRLDSTRTITITAEAGRLFAQVTDQDRFEIHPESDETFFWTVTAAQITFVTGSNGRVTHAVMHQGGRNLPAPRLDDGEAAP